METSPECPETHDHAEDNKESGSFEISYTLANEFWSGVEPTVDGMLGGYGKLSTVDIQGSEKFLLPLLKKADAPARKKAVDCGAGIGRITKHFLSKLFTSVDLVEQCSKLTGQATEYLKGNTRVGTIFNKGLQDFEPEPDTYDVVWIQWVLIYLTDEDLVKFLDRCRKSLRPRGMIVVKENIASTTETIADHEDSSVTRPAEVLEDLFKKANLRIVKQQKQQRFPSELFIVNMYALRPDH